jgi:hypothetical protein
VGSALVGYTWWDGDFGVIYPSFDGDNLGDAFYLPEASEIAGLVGRGPLLWQLGRDGRFGARDLSDPAVPVAPVFVQLPGEGTSFSLHGDRAYVLTSEPRTYDPVVSLTIVDIADPAAPVALLTRRVGAGFPLTGATSDGDLVGVVLGGTAVFLRDDRE